MDYYTCLHFSDLKWRLYTRFSSPVDTLAYVTPSSICSNGTSTNVGGTPEHAQEPVWKLCLSNYKYKVKFEATVHVKTDQTVKELKAYLNDIFHSRSTLVYEFFSPANTASASSSLTLESREQFSPLAQRLTITLPSTGFQLEFDKVEFNEQEEALAERMIHVMKKGSDRNEIIELIEQQNKQLERIVEVDSKKIEQLEQQAKGDAQRRTVDEQKIEENRKRIEQFEQRRKIDEQKIATLEGLVQELKLFKDEITAKQQKKQQEQQQRIGILKQNSSIVANSNDYMNHLAEWMREVGYKLHSRLYRASTDGFTSANFHSKCDSKGATLTIVRPSSGRIFGGFTVNSWQSSGGYVNTNGDKAWLFSLNSTTGPIRLNCIKQSNVQYNHSNYGPTFGGSHDLCMYLIQSHLFNFILYFNNTALQLFSRFVTNLIPLTQQQLYFFDCRCISTQLNTHCCRSLNLF